MKSEFLSMFGIPPTECEIEVAKMTWVCRDCGFDQQEICRSAWI